MLIDRITFSRVYRKLIAWPFRLLHEPLPIACSVFHGYKLEWYNEIVVLAMQSKHIENFPQQR